MKRTMRKSRLSATFILLLITTALWSKETGERKIHYDIPMNANGLFEVQNLYGNLIVTTEPNRNQVTVDITISLTERNEDRVQKYLDKISVELQNDPNHVQLKTIIDQKGCSFKGLEIEYLIRLPQNVSVDLYNRYGNIVVNQLFQQSKIELHYGDLKVDEMRFAENTIKLMYAEMKLNTAEALNIQARYSDVQIESLNQLQADFMYTDSRFESCENFTVKTRYGDVQLNHGDIVFIDGMYADIEVEHVEKHLKVITHYGDLEVDKINKNFQGVEIAGMYADITLSFESGSIFILNSDLKYAELSLPSDAAIVKKDGNSVEYQVESQHGQSESVKKRVSINSRYGDVAIK